MGDKGGLSKRSGRGWAARSGLFLFVAISILVAHPSQVVANQKATSSPTCSRVPSCTPVPHGEVVVTASLATPVAGAHALVIQIDDTSGFAGPRSIVWNAVSAWPAGASFGPVQEGTHWIRSWWAISGNVSAPQAGTDPTSPPVQVSVTGGGTSSAVVLLQ